MISRRLIVQLWIKYLGLILPGLPTHFLLKIWTSTRRYPTPEAQKQFLKNASFFQINFQKKRVMCYRWGEEDKVVLLVHGWNGQASQMGAFIEPLRKCGFSVIAFDAPGHGRSPGRHSNIFEFAQCIVELNKRFGPLAGIIAHSFGVPSTSFALKQKVFTKALVFISGPADYESSIRKFIEYMKIPVRIEQMFRHKLLHRFGEKLFEQCSTEITARELPVTTLIIHDKQDNMVPCEHAQRIAMVIPHSRTMFTQGYGHHAILRAKPVLDSTCEFIGQYNEEPSEGK